MTEQDQDTVHQVAELVPFPPTQTRTVDLRERSTDSWTDVVRDVARLADHVANTEFVPKELRGNAPAIAAAVLYGRELGLPPMTSLQGVAMVKGRPSLYAETMRALILQAGHEINIDEASSSRATISGRRKGQERWSSATWTLEDARTAGLMGRDGNYHRYPRQMLLARATTELARMIFADVIHGMRSAEEMFDELDTVTEPAPAEPVRTTTVQRKRPAKKAAAKPEPAASEAGKEEAPTDSDNPPKNVPADVTPPPARKRVDLPPPRAGEPGRTAGADDPAPPTDGPEAGPSTPSGPSTPEPPAGDEPQQGKDEPGNDAEIVDAEIVTGRSTGPKITASQRAALQMHFRRLGVDDRDEYLLIANLFLELGPDTIKSTNELRGDEPHRLMAILERLKDRDALDQRLAGQDQLVGGDE